MGSTRSPRPVLARRGRTKDPVRFVNARCLRATDKAIFVHIAAVPGRRAAWQGWIPQSQVHDDSEVWREDDAGALVVTRWIAEQKGLISGP